MVTLNVSSGPGKVKVPPVVGESETTAQNQLQNFHVVTKTDANSTKPEGTVVRQDPTGGTLELPGSTVTIWVSGGGTQVQNVVGDPQNTAIQILQGQGFKVHTIVTAGPADSTPGNVFQQTPANGTLPAGSTVTIYVASTPTPTPSATTPTPDAERHHADADAERSHADRGRRLAYAESLGGTPELHSAELLSRRRPCRSPA